MDYVRYLFRFDGRINRARCWLAGLIIVCWIIFLSGLMLGTAHLLGATMPETVKLGPNLIFNILDPKAWRSLSSANFTVLFIQSVGTPLFLWVYAATSVKRLHDRNKSAWWLLLFFALPGLYSQFGAGLEGDSWFGFLISTNAFVFSVWGFVEMYCLRGTKGTNRFGADPLAPIDTRPAWDQQSEIEMVPLKAGPPPVWRVKPGYE
jgi:uncharacterized membrane protein YhaH (DUF805 family)